MEYREYLAQKEIVDVPSGFDIGEMNSWLTPVQQAVTRWALRRGRAAIWADTGLGKTMMQAEWCASVSDHTGTPTLILAPLAVSRQTKKEAKKICVNVNVCKNQADILPGVNITNYEKLHLFDFSVFSGICLDESSILKSLSGKIRTKIIELSQSIPYRLACSATPAPNDYMELGNHAEFLGICTRSEMLSMFFVNDAGDTGKWRLKGHARDDFWKWLCSWAVMYSLPSNLGFSDDGYILPPLVIHEHVVKSNKPNPGFLFQIEAKTLQERRESRRESIDARVLKAKEIYENSDRPVMIWCGLNDESMALKSAITGAVEVTGSDSDEHKSDSMIDFADGKIDAMISKTKICGFGMNFQVCHTVIFCGLSDSYESFYQAIRRFWRFGQEHQVDVHVITGELDGAVVENIKRKENESLEMRKEMVKFMSDISKSTIMMEQKSSDDYSETKKSGLKWTIHHGDNVEIMKKIPDESFGYTLFSPPFASLFTYSGSVRDMGNCRDIEDFFIHFNFLANELIRVCQSGRLVSIHCMNIPAMKERDGYIGIKDFRGDLIRAMVKTGFIFHSEVVIWKDPLLEAVRTKSLGLMHKQLCKDSSMCRQGMPDYIISFRKPGNNDVKIEHKKGLWEYHGESHPVDKKYNQDQSKNKLSHNIWQRYASPVWWDIRQTNTLNIIEAREEKDEKHICPLQLDTIERCIELWSCENDLVFDPFSGIGSTGYVAVKNNRRYLGIELKGSYFETSIKNMARAEKDQNQLNLFSTEEQNV